MSDDSDDGERFPGESFFQENNNRIIEDNEENLNIDEERNNNYNDNYNENNYNNINNENIEEGEYNENNENDEEYYDDNNNYNYDYDYYYEDYEKSDYNESEDNYSHEYGNNYSYRSYNNNYYNNNSRYNNNHHYGRGFYKKNNNRRPNFNYFPVSYKSVKNKEFFLSLFEQKFKLWLMIVIKKEADNNKIKFSKDEKINKEIIESFVKLYDFEKNKKNENEVIKDKLSIRIDKLKEPKEVALNDFNLEFNLIIREEKEVFFIKKYIEIKVIGEIYYNKYPKFFFNLNQYKLYLFDEILNYIKKEENKNEEEKKDKSKIIIDGSTEEEEKKIDSTILNIENRGENNEQYIIGMCPDYDIGNKEFKKLFMDLKQNVDEEENKNIKGPQKEIIDCLFDIKEILTLLY